MSPDKLFLRDSWLNFFKTTKWYTKTKWWKLFIILFLQAFEWIYNPIYMVKGVSWEFLCCTGKTICSSFRLMTLKLTSWERPTTMSRVLLSSKTETFVPSNIICGNTCYHTFLIKTYHKSQENIQMCALFLCNKDYELWLTYDSHFTFANVILDLRKHSGFK